VRQALSGYIGVGRRPAFRRFWFGMMISRAGDAFTIVALSWLVLGIAGPVQLGLVLMCFGLPRIVGAPVAGRLLDRSRPRILLVLDNAGRGLLIAAVPVLLWTHHLAVAGLYPIAAACALLSSVTEVAEAALVPRLVHDDQLDAANSLLSANWEVASIAGPAVAGVIVASIGAPVALLIDAVSFAVMSAICLTLPLSGPAPAPAGAASTPAASTPAASDAHAGASTTRRNWLGLGILLRFPGVLTLTACGFGMLFLDGIATVLYPLYCRRFLHVSATGYGLLVAAAGVGALIGVVAGPALSGRLPPSRRIGVVIVAGAPLFGLLRVAPGLPVAAGLLGLAMFAWGPYYVLDRTLIQRLVPDEMRSRLVGARMTISALGFPLGSAAGGAVLGALGAPGVVVAVACCYLALGLLPLFAPGLRALDSGPAASRIQARPTAG
jgi:predicted MFS family arabinose efflux permease